MTAFRLPAGMNLQQEDSEEAFPWYAYVLVQCYPFLLMHSCIIMLNYTHATQLLITICSIGAVQDYYYV